MTSIAPYTPRVTPQPWGDEILIAEGPGYAGKILRRYASPEHHRAGLQWHQSRDETFHLVEGEVDVYFVDHAGALRVRRMRPGESFHVPPGAVHSVQTVTDSVMFEASNGAFSDRVRVEEQYDVRKAVPID